SLQSVFRNTPNELTNTDPKCRNSPRDETATTSHAEPRRALFVAPSASSMSTVCIKRKRKLENAHTAAYNRKSSAGGLKMPFVKLRGRAGSLFRSRLQSGQDFRLIGQNLLLVRLNLLLIREQRIELGLVGLYGLLISQNAFLIILDDLLIV